MAVRLETALEQRVDVARHHAHAVRVVPGEVRGNEVIGDQFRLARLAAARGYDRLDRAGQGTGLEYQRVGHRYSVRLDAAAAAAAAAQMTQRCIAFSLARQRVYLFGDAMRHVASWYISTTPSFGVLAMKCAFALTLIAALQAALPAQAQPYPSRPIRLIVPYAAGGTSDILARQIAPKLNEAWGQPVIVENKTGANGNVGADFVAKSAADGYTLLLTDLGGLVISASVYPKLPFDPSRDFSPVAMGSYSPHV